MHLSELLSEQLQRFHFPGFIVSPSTTKTARILNTRMADLTPLSISLPLDKKTKSVLCEQDSYEARIRKRGFKPDDSPKFDFGSDYRDIQATSLSAVGEAYQAKRSPNHPAAALPSSADKSVEDYNIDAIPPKTGQTPAEAPLLAGNPLASDPGSKLQPQGHVCQTFNLDTPALITAESSSSVPSSTEFTKEQVVNITDKDGYRPTARDSYPSDQEEDSDYERVTESDLETHAGDDDFDYTADPEDEGCDSLQSHFSNMGIRKRQRGDVEDAEDDNEAGEKADTAHLDGSRKQKTLKLPLTEDKCARPVKKSRTAKQSFSADDGRDSHGTGGVA